MMRYRNHSLLFGVMLLLGVFTTQAQTDAKSRLKDAREQLDNAWYYSEDMRNALVAMQGYFSIDDVHYYALESLASVDSISMNIRRTQFILDDLRYESETANDDKLTIELAAMQRLSNDVTEYNAQLKGQLKLTIDEEQRAALNQQLQQADEQLTHLQRSLHELLQASKSAAKQAKK